MTSRLKIAVIATDNRRNGQADSALAPRFDAANEALFGGFAQLPDLEVHVVSCVQQAMKSVEKLADNTWFHSVYVPKAGWMRSSYQGCVRAVRRKLKAIRPDIVHGQGTERECAVSAVFSKFPNILTIHGNMRHIAKISGAKPFSLYWLAAQLEEMALPRTRGVICVTGYNRDAVKDLAKQTWIVPSAMDQSFFDINAEPDTSRTILCIGDVGVRKNQNAFIKALDPIAAEGRFKVAFLGNLNKHEAFGAEFLDLVAQRPWCEFAGCVNRDAVRQRLKTASVLALPSIEDNCPMAVLEAMAAGVPILAAKVGGLPDLIEDGKTGLFCDPADPVSIQAGVTKLLNDTALAGQLATAAKTLARERFHPLAIARRHVEIYREVLSRPS